MRGARAAWLSLAVFAGIVGAQLLHDVLNLGGSGLDELFDTWLAITAVFGAAALCVWRGLTYAPERGAWVVIGAGIASSAGGDVIYAVLYRTDSTPPLYAIYDLLYLAWYPLLIVGFGLLLRRRVPRFHLQRWVDGIALAALGATPLMALVMEPVIATAGVSGFAAAVAFSYPLADMLLGGAAIGVFPLLGWQRPAWLLLITGAFAIEVVADSLYAVQVAAGTYVPGTYDFLWSGAVLLIAAAAWLRPRAVADPRPLHGLPAIALPLTCQFGAGTLKFVGYFHGLGGVTEFVMSLVLLGIGMLKLVTMRPRPSGAAAQK